MTDSGEGSPSRTAEEFLREERETTRPFDPQLLDLVHLINSVDGPEIGITLHLRGTVVSGMLISIAQYYRLLVRGFTDRLSDGSSREIAASFAEFYRPALETAEKAVAASKKGEEQLELPRHLHFRHAQTFVGGGQEPFTQPLWRGRLASVDGWAIGNFGRIPPLSEDEDPRTAG